MWVGAKQCNELVEVDGAAVAPTVQVCALEGKPRAKGGIPAPIQPACLGHSPTPAPAPGLSLGLGFSLAELELPHKGVKLSERERAVQVGVMSREQPHQRTKLRIVHQPHSIACSSA